MQGTSKAFLGLVALALAATTPALAQDTTNVGRTPPPSEKDTLTMPGQGGAADTSGFAGMERDDPTGAKKGDTTAVETGAVKPTETETQPAPTPAKPGAAESKDPNGFRWTEPSDFGKSGAAPTPPAGAEQKKDTLTLPGQGGGADTSGYSGAERNKPSPKDSTKP
jgi:hypothetical protein